MCGGSKKYLFEYLLKLWIYISKFQTRLGTLIKRNVVLTAAHCIPKTVEYSYDGNPYETDVEPNSYYPTVGSMHKVYLGFHDLNEIGSSSTGVEMEVSEVIPVIWAFWFIIIFIKIS